MGVRVEDSGCLCSDGRAWKASRRHSGDVLPQEARPPVPATPCCCHARAQGSVLAGLCLCYVLMQTFAIPGTLALSVLSGALYGVKRGSLLVAGACLTRVLSTPAVHLLPHYTIGAHGARQGSSSLQHNAEVQHIRQQRPLKVVTTCCRCRRSREHAGLLQLLLPLLGTGEAAGARDLAGAAGAVCGGGGRVAGGRAGDGC